MVTAVHGTWIPIDDEPGYRRLYTIMGSVICHDLETREIVDEAHCDDTSTEIGAMAELGLVLGSGPRPVTLGGGYRLGDGKGPFLSLGWGPGFRDPKGSWQALARVGGEFLEVGGVISFRPRRSRGEDRRSTVESIPRPLLGGVELTR
jgi:hypothetical protein